MCKIVNSGVHRILQEHKREGGHFYPTEPGIQGYVEDIMLALNIGLYRGLLRKARKNKW